MWLPVGYDTPINEYWNTIERAGIWDVGVQRIVEISGPDAEAFMNLLTPRDVSKVSVGQCRYVFLTNQDGGVINDPVLLRIEQNRFWLSTADSDIYLWAKGVSSYAGYQVDVQTPDVYPLQVQGPKSPDIIATVFGDTILDLAYYHWIKTSVNGIDVVISRTGFSSEVGFEVYLVGYDRGNELWEIILEAGKPHGLSPGSPNRIRRIEGGVLDFGADILPSNNPVELGMSRLISTDKNDYIGKAAIDRVLAEGPARMMKGALIGGEAFQKNNEHRWRATDGERFAGEVTSAVYSPRLEQNIGFILADLSYAENGTRLEVETPEGTRTLEITELPFLDKEKSIPRRSLRG
jgi:glycine cleavage system aminomethyltransferase T